jgi:2-keto-4-pentenoate hydratase/2-oxohepta-3-ene-1,7-dioic acid hydratase in catechol pathway
MRLATFTTKAGGEPRVGVLSADTASLIDLDAESRRLNGETLAAFSSMQALIESGEAGLSAARDIAQRGRADHPLDGVRLLAPLPRPVQIRDCMCFEGHLVGSMQAAARFNGGQVSERSLAMQRVFHERPIYYKANRFAVCGPDVDIMWPPYSKLMDYELEMGCIIGRPGRDIRREDAASHIFGFTIFNDLSARDTQRLEMESGLGPSKSKDFDNANVLGPWIVTADDFAVYNAEMTVRVNGELRSAGSSSTMTYKFEDLIAFISRHETLHAGEILCSGTVGGGCGLEAGRLLESGDLVELTIAGIGTLRSRIFASQ